MHFNFNAPSMLHSPSPCVVSYTVEPILIVNSGLTNLVDSDWLNPDLIVAVEDIIEVRMRHLVLETLD